MGVTVDGDGDGLVGATLASPCDLALRGTVVPPTGDVFRGEVRIAGGRIVEIVPVSAGSEHDLPCKARIDVGDAYLLPGAIDAHVHCFSYPGEGIDAATRSAAAGGVTTIVEMPYDQGNPVTTAPVLRDKADRVPGEAWVDVALLGTVKPVGGASDVAELVEAGACGFKLSLFHTDPDRFPRIPDVELLDVFAAIAEVGSVACVHAENDEIIKPLIERAIAAGRTGAREHAASRPPVSETQAVLKALEFANATGCRLHVCHASLPRSVDLVRWYADAYGVDVTVETCPHYLVFTEDDLARQGGRLKINPPVRSLSDVEGMWDRLARGKIDYVASDHAPWPTEYKDHRQIFENHSGAPGVETIVPLTVAWALQRGITIQQVARALATNPAERLGLAGRKGALRPGADADVVVFDPSQSWTIDQKQLHSKAGWSPYHGMTVHGKVTQTISRGEVVWDGSALVGRAGRGKVVRSARSRGAEGSALSDTCA